MHALPVYEPAAEWNRCASSHFNRGSSSSNWSMGTAPISSHILDIKQKTETQANTLSACVGYWAAISASSFEKYSFLIKLSIKHWVLRILLTSSSRCTFSKVTKDGGPDPEGAWGRLSTLPISWSSMAMTARCRLFHIHLWKVAEVWHKVTPGADFEHNALFSSTILGLQTAYNIHSIQKHTHSGPLLIASMFVRYLTSNLFT